jgi:DNA-binding transcriptional ArsR family regulator
MNPFELLAHPVRVRLVHALRGSSALTTAELSARIPDVSKATLYRHIDLLASGGVLEVASERRARGAVERSYRLRSDRASIDASALAPDDYRSAFAAAMVVLVAEFSAYLARDGIDPAADLVGFRQHAVWLSSAELVEVNDAVRAALTPHLSNTPASDRSQYLISPIQFPIAPPVSPHGGSDVEQEQHARTADS